jgi:hypothetical protein
MQVLAQSKVMGPLGIWRMSNGYVYSAPGIPESTYVQDAFKFGDFWNMDNPGDEGLTFAQWLNKGCEEWDSERYTGVIRPPSEGGVINKPADTALFAPMSNPGMIQGAVRFSRLAKLYGQIYGVNIDDFGGLDTNNVRDIQDALRGKYVDSTGTVYHETPSTTPWLKLFVVIYPHRTSLATKFVPYIDGINLWYYNQNGLYTLFDSDLDSYRSMYPGKEINFGVYMMNSDYGWMTPVSISYLYHHLLDRYDDGHINGFMLFAGHWIIIPYITRTQWDNDHISSLLDTVYYPFIGKGQGRVYNSSMQQLDSVFITCFTYGRVSGDSLIRSKKRTDSTGAYYVNVWAGNRNTDSTKYYVAARKDGYVSDTVWGWVHRSGLTIFPDLILEHAVGIKKIQGSLPDKFYLYQNNPNPFNPVTKIRFDVSSKVKSEMSNVRLVVFDFLGREIITLVNQQLIPGKYNAEFNGTNYPSGIYFYRLTVGDLIQTKKMVLVK